MSQPSSSAGSTLPVLSFGSVPPVSSSSSTIPQFIQPPPSTDQDPTAHSVINVVKAVLKAKRIAVVCGAGISTASGIPDFRSSEGLFESLKRQYPEARLSSGKDLFDAGLFASEETASIFYTMIASLKQMSDKANPTAFHQFLKLLDDEGKLFRVYTQNIDGLEERAGLSYGLGNRDTPIPPLRASTSASRKSLSTTSSQPQSSQPSTSTSTPGPTTRTRSHSPSTPPSSTSSPPPSQAQIGSLDPSGIPRCIPLHGQLSTLSCPHCSSIFSIEPYLALLSTGVPSACPTCLVTDEQRRSNGSRSRGVGRLKPDVVLYGESHPEGERVGSITRRDLMGVRPDLLIVVGTSLKVPGTKLLVRELAKVIKPTPKATTATTTTGDEMDLDEDGFPASSFASATSTSSQPTGSQPRPKVPKSKPVHSIYLNLDFPTPSREWKDVFDVWMRGDVQEFVGLVGAEREREEERARARRREKEEREARKIERELIKANPTLAAQVKADKAKERERDKVMAKAKVVSKVKDEKPKVTLSKHSLAFIAPAGNSRLPTPFAFTSSKPSLTTKKSKPSPAAVGSSKAKSLVVAMPAVSKPKPKKKPPPTTTYSPPPPPPMTRTGSGRVVNQRAFDCGGGGGAKGL